MIPPSDRRDAASGGDSWVAVAHILRPRGLRGLMRLKPLTPGPADLLDHPDVPYHARRGDVLTGPYRVRDGYVERDLLLARFEGIEDRNAADALVGCDLVVREEQLWEAGSEAWYLHELEGLALLDDETGAVIGRVVSGREGAAHDYLEIELDRLPGEKLLLPLVPAFVPEIDTAAGRARVRIPEGLIEAR